MAIMVALGIASTGCATSQATRCGDLICPVGRACARGTCVDESIVTACGRLAEGASCTLPEIGTGTCQTGLCLVGTCGDGVINAIDACDGAELGGKTCLDFGSNDAGGLACTADCSFDTTRCTAFCGDGTKNTSEPCDGTDFAGRTCITEGFYTGKLVCTSDCAINVGDCSGRCGDNLRNSFVEQCDGADFDGSTCATRGYLGAVSPLLCTPACSFDPTSCTCGSELCLRNTQQCVLIDEVYTCEVIP